MKNFLLPAMAVVALIFAQGMSTLAQAGPKPPWPSWVKFYPPVIHIDPLRAQRELAQISSGAIEFAKRWEAQRRLERELLEREAARFQLVRPLDFLKTERYIPCETSVLPDFSVRKSRELPFLQ